MIIMETNAINNLIENENIFWRDILLEIMVDMDPWDIDISALATTYSIKVEEMQKMSFKIPANVIIVSAVLLRMKADRVNPVDVDIHEFMLDDEGLSFPLHFNPELYFNVDAGILAEQDNGGNGKLQDIEIKPKRVLKRRVTAIELINAIQEVLKERKGKKFKLRNDKKKILEINVGVDIEKLITDTYSRIMEILSTKKLVPFSELTDIREDREDAIDVFISLLHLAHKQKLKLEQKKLYEEIFIRRV